MAEELSPTARMTTEHSDCHATPESWEMRLGWQTSEGLQSSARKTVNNQESSLPILGMSDDSFTGYLDFAMYETPPGAQLYREQCSFDSFNMSYQDADTANTPENVDSDIKTNELLSTNEDCAGVSLQNEANFTHQSPSSGECSQTISVPVMETCSTIDGQHTTTFESEKRIEHEDKENSAFDDRMQVHVVDIGAAGKSHFEEEADQSDYMPTDEAVTAGCNGPQFWPSQNTVQECVLERLDYQQSEQIAKVERDNRSNDAAELAEGEGLHVDRSSSSNEVSVLWKCSDQDQRVDVPLLSATGYSSTNDRDFPCAVKDNTECAAEIYIAHDISTSATGNADIREENRDCSGVKESGVKSVTTSDTAFSSGGSSGINYSLLSMGVPQDAIELNQLADFLNMEDPFQNAGGSQCVTDRKQKPVDIGTDMDIGDYEGNPVASKETHSPLPSPKRTRRKKKGNVVSERRRSVRIARRASLLSGPSDYNDPICNVPDNAAKVTVENKCKSSVPVPAPSGKDPTNQKIVGQQLGIVSLPFPDVGERSPEKPPVHSDTVCSVPVEAIESFCQRAAVDGETLEQVSIDLPMPTRRGRKVKSGRRKSVRRLVQDSGTKSTPEDDLKSEKKPVEVAKGNVCDNTFLADFADFGLGDNWMPGEIFSESQFARTPKQKSSRRKSARLSGVPIPLLELRDKSTIKVSGGIGMNDDDVMKTYPLPDKDFVESSVSSAPMDSFTSNKFELQGSAQDILESIGDLPFEKGEADIAKNSSRQKKSRAGRRRSVRLAKKPVIEYRSEFDSDKENQPLMEKDDAGCKKREHDQGSVLIQTLEGNGDIVPTTLPTKSTVFPILKECSEDYPMECESQPSQSLEQVESNDRMDVQGTQTTVKKRISRDTPYLGRKRVSRISDEEKDDVMDQTKQEKVRGIKDTPVIGRKRASRVNDKENDVEEKDNAVTQETMRQREPKETTRCDNKSTKITKKIKQLYLNKGGDIKKHKSVNLETIIESPARRESGTPLKTLGGKKMKRTVAFTETPWLGRSGRTKGRKVKKGTQFKRVLSSKAERCWKLDIRLSTLDELS